MKGPASHFPRSLRLLYEDDSVIVVEKDSGLLVQETRHGSERCVEDLLTNWVRKGQLRSRKCVYLVHRLDRETSGVMMVAKSPQVQDWFRTNWNDVTKKTYVARVEGLLKDDAGFFESYLAEDADGYRVRSVKDVARGKLARTQWKVLTREKGITRVEVVLKSGRKNQIRVHFSEAGYPVVGDVKYGARKSSRLFLHACKLSFIHPQDGQWRTFESSIPF